MSGYAKISTQPKEERMDIEKYIEMERLYLLNRYRGRKIGALLMDYCIRHARGQGFDMLWLNVWERNTGAIEFYRH